MLSIFSSNLLAASWYNTPFNLNLNMNTFIETPGLLIKPPSRTDRLMAEYTRLISISEKQRWLSHLQTPLIETINEDPDHCLVTFLFQRPAVQDASIYLYSPTTGFPCAPGSMLVNYPETDLDYLTLLLPANLRMSYSFLIISREYHYEENNTSAQLIYPLPAGELARSLWLFNQLMADNAVSIDPHNPKTIIYYKDWENSVEFWAKESILELPKAPAALISEKNNLMELYQQKRLFRDILQFNGTYLSRKYWVYFHRIISRVTLIH